VPQAVSPEARLPHNSTSKTNPKNTPITPKHKPQAQRAKEKFAEGGTKNHKHRTRIFAQNPDKYTRFVTHIPFFRTTFAD
jgi:hypothetical protein